MRRYSTFTAVIGLSLVLGACGDEKAQDKKPAPAPVKKVEAPAPKPAALAEDKNLDMTPKEALENMQKDAGAVVDKVEELATSATEKMGDAVTSAVQAVTMSGDPIKGEKVFEKCQSCHSATQGGKNKVGPNLFGVVGRAAGSVDGFKYSKSMAAFNTPWSVESIVEYVANPTDFLKKKTGDTSAKSKMTFKLKDEQARHDVAAFLDSLK